MRIGIIGAGPSGSYLAYLLSREGGKVLLFDKFVRREKPCGGGVTFKALDSFAIFKETGPKSSLIKELKFMGREGEEFHLPLEKPLRIFSRKDLDGFICQKAVDSGAEFIPEPVVGFGRANRFWTIQTRTEKRYQVDFLVGADGAKSLVRSKVSRSFSKEDLSLTIGYYVPGNPHPHTAICKFLEKGFRGYLWSFPRHDHLSVGIISDLSHAQSSEMKTRVKQFIFENYPDAACEACFYSAVVPELTSRGWAENTFNGDSWALVGDAAGLVDPVTGEGIYYALRSAELLAEALQRGDAERYGATCRRELVDDLVKAAEWKDRFGSLFSIIARVTLGSWRSRSLQKLENDYIAGRVNYATFGRRLLKKAPTIVTEVAKSKLISAVGRK